MSEVKFKYKVGDKVKIVDELPLNNSHWAPSMRKYCGKTMVIERVGEGNWSDGKAALYNLRDIGWNWKESDFVGLAEESPTVDWDIVWDDFKIPTIKTTTFNLDYLDIKKSDPKVTCKEVPATFGVVVYQKECLNCGTRSEYDAKYCRKCGKPLIW